jgi:hypothetical protein
MDIGPNLDGKEGWVTLGIGVMMACFHCCGTVPVAVLSGLLINWAMSAAKIGAPTRGVGTMPVAHQVLLPLVRDDPRYLYASSFFVRLFIIGLLYLILRTLACYNVGLLVR